MKPFNPTIKQSTAFRYLIDDHTRFILFGGGAGGGKSYLGIGWLVTMSKAYPGTKWFIGRKELKRIMGTTYITFLKFCRDHEVTDWRLNGQYNYIEFSNGSRIDLLDVDYKPSDPLYERFGSSEYTGGWLEEIGEISFEAYDVLKSRINRHMNREYNLFPKIFLTCNPKKHWAYYGFYKPWKENRLAKGTVFIQSLYMDNPYTAEDYGESLAQIKDKAKRQRLMLGDWEYEDDPAALIDQDKIMDLFTNEPRVNRQRYITCDVARFGPDLTIFYLWQGLHMTHAWFFPKTSVKETRDEGFKIAAKYQVPASNVCVDEDGVGGGVIDFWPGAKGFVNNASPIRTKEEREKKLQNYRNLKAQCYYRLADYINLGRMSISASIPQKIKDGLIEDLQQVKSKDPDNDMVQEIISKDEVKKVLGRSPDYSDALMIRMFFELNKAGYGARSG